MEISSYLFAHSFHSSIEKENILHTERKLHSESIISLTYQLMDISIKHKNGNFSTSLKILKSSKSRGTDLKEELELWRFSGNAVLKDLFKLKQNHF